MSDTDSQLLARYTEHGAEDAFTEIVRRHIDLVFSAALRQVGSRQLAEEVSQSAFTDLARQAPQLARGTILTAWLYQVARRTAIDVVRREARRQSRERIATEMNALSTPATDWTQMEPLLDEAMQTLDDNERAAVLLRYFDKKSLREVGEALGTSEEAARKRIGRAVERLREFFAKRGLTIGANALALAIAANAVQAAPAALVTTISTAAVLAGTAVSASTLTAATKTIAMTALQKVLVTTALVVSVAVGVHEAHEASTLRSQNRALLQQQASLADQLQRFQQERDDATSALASVQGQNAQLRRDYAVLPRPRGESGPSASMADAWAKGANSFKQWFNEHPDKSIPELRLLWEDNWLITARMNPAVHTNAADGNTYEMIACDLRQDAKSRLAVILGHALSLYVAANAGELPNSLAQLLQYVPQEGGPSAGENAYWNSAVPVDESMLQRYQLQYTGPISNVPPGEPIVVETAPVDARVDSLLKLTAGSFCYESVGVIDMMAGQPRGWAPGDLERIKPFLQK